MRSFEKTIPYSKRVLQEKKNEQESHCFFVFVALNETRVILDAKSVFRHILSNVLVPVISRMLSKLFDVCTLANLFHV